MIQREMEKPVADPLSRLPIIESIMFALQSIVRDLPMEDWEVSAQLLSFVATIPESSSSELKRTTIRLIGKLPHWTPLSAHIPQHLSSLVTTLVNPKLSLCSAQAIMNICRVCEDITQTPFVEIAKTFDALRQSKSLPSEPESYLIEGLCRLVSRAPIAEQASYLQMVLTPIESTLQIDLAANHVGGQQVLLSDVAAMTSLFKFINVDKSLRPHLVQYFSKVQPLLDTAMKRFPTDMMCEEVCRCFRSAMRMCGSDFAPLIPSMCTYLVQSFQQYPFSAFIYATQEVMVTSKTAQLDGSIVLPMIGAISETFLTKMNSLDKFINQPDLVEEFFFLISKTIENFSLMIIHSSMIPAVIEAAIVGLQLEHREAQKGILTFFEKMLRECIHAGDERAQNLVECCADRIISALIPMMSGSVHWFSLDNCARYVLHSLRTWSKFEVSSIILFVVVYFTSYSYSYCY